MTRTSLFLVRPAAAAFLSLLLACGEKSPQAEPSTATPLAAVTLTGSDIALAREMSLVDGVAMSGSLEPAQTVIVKAQVPGRLGNISVDRGSRVGKGQELVVIEAEGVRGMAASARAAVASAEAALALATQRLESAKRLQAAGAISDIDLRASEAAHQAATAQLAAARAQLASAAEAEARTKVTAPLAGVISARAVEAGEAVNGGDQLFTIVDISTLELRAQVGVNEAMKIKVGSPVTFTLDALPGRMFRGRVARIDPRADPATRKVGLAAQLANPGGQIVAGQFAHGRVLAGSPANVVAIPVAAVSDSAGQARVYLIQNGTLVLTPVTLGTRDDAQGMVAVLSGISVNDRILARPVVGAANGLAVTVASDTAAAGSSQGGAR